MMCAAKVLCTEGAATFTKAKSLSTRYRIKLTKATFQNRARVAIVLYRLDIAGAPHRNLDGEKIPCPHLHFYREGYGAKWAIPAPLDKL
jgi:hypothetical protein